MLCLCLRRMFHVLLLHLGARIITCISAARPPVDMRTAHFLLCFVVQTLRVMQDRSLWSQALSWTSCITARHANLGSALWHKLENEEVMSRNFFAANVMLMTGNYSARCSMHRKSSYPFLNSLSVGPNLK